MMKEIKVLLIFVLVIIWPTSLVNASDVISLLLGDLCAWGNNNFGQLGDSTTMPRWKPVQVHELTSVIAFSGGYSHSLAIRASDFTVWAWGWNERGQLGNGTTNPAFLPCEPGSVLISGGFTAVEAGGKEMTFRLHYTQMELSGPGDITATDSLVIILLMMILCPVPLM